MVAEPVYRTWHGHLAEQKRLIRWSRHIIHH